MQPEILKPTNGGSASYYVDPAQHNDGATTIKLLLYAVFKRKWQVLAVIAVVVLSILASGLLRAKMYKSNAKVMVRPSRAEVQVGPGDDRSITLPVTATMEMLNSEMEILKSSELMRQVLARFDEAGTPIFGADSDKTREEQIGIMKQLLTVTPAPQSNVISIDFLARDPKKAQVIVAAIIQAYLERYGQVHGNSRAKEFFQTQMDEHRARVEAAETAMATFVEREGLVVPEDQIRWAFKDSVRNQDAVRTQKNKIAALERHITTYRQQLAAMPERTLADVERINPVASTLASQLGELEAKRANLLQLYNRDDRMVTDLDGEIAAVRAQLSSSADTAMIGRERMSANPVRQDIERQLLNAQRNLVDLQARMAFLPQYIDKQSAEDRQEAIDLRKKSIAFAALEQEVAAARDSYRLYERKQEEARISEALDREGILNVRVLEAATLPVLPANALSPIMLVVALIAGAGLGGASAVGLEFLNRNFKLEEQVEQYLDLPVFAVIPDLSNVGERQA